MKKQTLNSWSHFSVVWISIIFKIICVGASGELDFYSFTVMDVHENIVSLEQYRGKVSLVVNVASKCGYTEDHYNSLVRLQELLADTNKFNVLAFPCNQFGGQEPGSNLQIFHFARHNYGADFPMFAKVDVRGPNALDAWKYLTEKTGYEPDWNFWKFLIDTNGKVVNGWGPWMSPDKLYNIIVSTIHRAEEAEEAEQKEQKSKEKTSRDGEL